MSEQTVLAIPDTEENDVLEALCTCVYRGSEENVLDRLIETAQRDGFDYFYRLTGDNPIVDRALHAMVYRTDLDYCVIEEYIPVGLQSEFIKTEALLRLREIVGDDPYYQEHPTQGFHHLAHYFNTQRICAPRGLLNMHLMYRLTIDYQEDADMFKAMFAEIGCYPTALEAIAFLQANPEIANINSHIEQEHGIGSPKPD